MDLEAVLILAQGIRGPKEGGQGEELAGGGGERRPRRRPEGVGRGDRGRRRRGGVGVRNAAHKGRRREEGEGGKRGEGRGARQSPWAMYQRFMSERYDVAR